MNNGYVMLHRAINDNKLWLLEPFTKAQAWVDLFLNANWKDGVMNIRGNIINIKRGQIGWSELTMKSRWKWSRNKVRAFLLYLEKEGNIVQQKGHLTTIITICKYETFQNDTDSKVQQKVQQKDSRRTAEGTRMNKVNKDNKENISADFKMFWSAYPRKKGKEKSKVAYEKYHKHHAEMMTALEAQKKQHDWIKNDGEFIPYPTTWLNGKRWEDEISSETLFSNSKENVIVMNGRKVVLG